MKNWSSIISKNLQTAIYTYFSFVHKGSLFPSDLFHIVHINFLDFLLFSTTISWNLHDQVLTHHLYLFSSVLILIHLPHSLNLLSFILLSDTLIFKLIFFTRAMLLVRFQQSHQLYFFLFFQVIFLLHLLNSVAEMGFVIDIYPLFWKLKTNWFSEVNS